MTRAERRAQAVTREHQLCQGIALDLGNLGELVPGLLHNQCQKVTRMCLGVGPGYASAIIAWSHVDKADRHPGRDGPPGVPGYFNIGSYGHAVILDGDGYCWSTDIKRRGEVDRVEVSFIEHHWNAQWLGWAETINGVRVFGSDRP